MTLLAAALYNICWGAWMTCFPQQSLGVMGYPPEGASLWQGIGVLIGIFGIGYAIAAFNPVRHWLVVFLGLLSKVLAGTGALGAALMGTAPPMAGWLSFPNDIIWWIPFAAILWTVFRLENEQAVRSSPSIPLEEALQTFRSQNGETLQELSSQNPLLVVFLRHAGCTFCREAVSDISRQRSEIERHGTRIAFVALNDRADIEPILQRYGVADLPCFSDPNEQLYRAFELQSGSFFSLFSLGTVLRGLKAILAGHGLGKLAANGFRLGGTFLLQNGRVVRGQRLQTSSERPNYSELACPAR